MRRASALAEAAQPGPSHRRREARNTDDQLLPGEVHDLEPVQSPQRLHRDARLYAEAGSEITEVDIATARSLLEHPPQPPSERGRRRTEMLRPHPFEIRVAQPSPIIGLCRQRNDVEGAGIWYLGHALVKARPQVERDIEAPPSTLDEHLFGE